ncbi:PadR family transcriptional regulator [Streptosporangium sp. NPDC049376]|uniref:PadR family transcriptional regulator n=1 Tax=Streptosporangium sp. NPDC049376 TaxID=3366192 RepID=UPI0037AD5335
MTSTLGYAILTALARRPRSGYELATAMGHPLGCFWTARHSQIHPELQRLVAAELVTFEQVPGPGPQRKKIYSITRLGTRELREWVIEPPQSRPERDELLLKSYAAWLADPAELIKLFQIQLEEHERRLATYEDERSAFSSAPGRESRRFGDYATLWYGISYENHRIAWCRWMIDQLRARSARTSRLRKTPAPAAVAVVPAPPVPSFDVSPRFGAIPRFDMGAEFGVGAQFDVGAQFGVSP